jgi:hypothetical protein
MKTLTEYLIFHTETHRAAPEKAMLIARPRQRTNQFGKNCECAV